MLSLVSRVLMIPDKEPRPAVESAGLNVTDVIRHQILAELVPLVRAHPKLVRAGTKLNPDRIPDSPPENILLGAVRIELENAGPIAFRRVVGSVRERTDGDIHFLSIRRERDVAGPMTAAAEQAAAGKVRAQFFRGAARLRVAVAIGKTHDAVCVGDVEKLRVGPRRIKRDPEGFVHSAVGERFGQVRFPVPVLVAQDLDAALVALGHEEIAIRRSEEVARIRKAARILFDLETGWDAWLSAGRAPNLPRTIVNGLGGVRRGQVVDREFVADSGSVRGPISCDWSNRRFGEEGNRSSGRGERQPGAGGGRERKR